MQLIQGVLGFWGFGDRPFDESMALNDDNPGWGRDMATHAEGEYANLT